MAKRNAVVEKGSQNADVPLKKVTDGRNPRLQAADVERAARALIAHMKKHAQEKESEKSVRNLADDEDEAEDNDQPIFLSITTKKHIHESNSMKPYKIIIPHPFTPNDIRVCLFTKDPQRAYKNLIDSDAFPALLRAKVQRVLGVEKLRKRYKSFEQKRALQAEYDIFLVDDRVAKIVAEFLGKTFYKSKAKRPIPVRLTAGVYVDKMVKKDKKSQDIVGTPFSVAKEIEAALNSTYLSLSASMNTSIKVGTVSQTPQQLSENTTAVVESVVSKHIPQGWKNVRTLYIKGPSTKALPIWEADQLWTDDTQVLDGPHIGTIKDAGTEAKGKRKRKFHEWEEEMLDDEDLTIKEAQHEAKEAKKAKRVEGRSSISKERRKALKDQVMQSVQAPPISG